MRLRYNKIFTWKPNVFQLSETYKNRNMVSHAYKLLHEYQLHLNSCELSTMRVETRMIHIFNFFSAKTNIYYVQVKKIAFLKFGKRKKLQYKVCVLSVTFSLRFYVKTCITCLMHFQVDLLLINYIVPVWHVSHVFMTHLRCLLIRCVKMLFLRTGILAMVKIFTRRRTFSFYAKLCKI